MATDHPLSRNPADSYTGSSADEPTLIVPAVRRRRRWVRPLLTAVVLLAVASIAAGVTLYADPPLLVPVGNVFLGVQPGAVVWNGADPINILVMGIDQRTVETPHSDTMIVVHVDPMSQSVTMLSVPRDLWVNVPNYGFWKINAAFSNGYNAVFGAQGQQAGLVLGAQFAQLAVENSLHIPINYYAVLKFTGFKSVVDALGGVTVCVPRELNDPLYPADIGNGYHPIDIKAGCQAMDGTVALEYARERHADAQQDLGRIQQQQALLSGIEKQLLLPGTLLRIPALLSAVNGAVITDLPHNALPELGLLLGRARGARTRHYYINVDGGYVANAVVAGQDVLVPNWTQIGALVAQALPDASLRREAADVQFRNGQHAAGLADLYSSVFAGMGFNTVSPRDADRNTYVRNLVIVNQDRPIAAFTARKVAQMLEADVAYRHVGADQPQIVAILGSDATQGQ